MANRDEDTATRMSIPVVLIVLATKTIVVGQIRKVCIIARKSATACTMSHAFMRREVNVPSDSHHAPAPLGGVSHFTRDRGYYMGRCSSGPVRV